MISKTRKGMLMCVFKTRKGQVTSTRKGQVTNLLCLVVHVCLHTRSDARKSLPLAALFRELALGFVTVLTVSPFAMFKPSLLLAHFHCSYFFCNFSFDPVRGFARLLL
jgi:hypothetical protein